MLPFIHCSFVTMIDEKELEELRDRERGGVGYGEGEQDVSYKLKYTKLIAMYT